MLEVVGKQIRIRIRNPKRFLRRTFKTRDVGRKGGLQFVVGISSDTGRYVIQAVRLSTDDFKIIRKKIIPKTRRGKKELSSLLNSRDKKVVEKILKYT